MKENLCIAIDLGAGSGRVFLGGFGEKFSLEEVHRFQYLPQNENEHLRWNFSKIFSEVKFGLKRASAIAAAQNRKITSIGVDSWAVDYGLLDENGDLLENPICYRDKRTNSAMRVNSWMYNVRMLFFSLARRS